MIAQNNNNIKTLITRIEQKLFCISSICSICCSRVTKRLNKWYTLVAIVSISYIRYYLLHYFLNFYLECTLTFKIKFKKSYSETNRSTFHNDYFDSLKFIPFFDLLDDYLSSNTLFVLDYKIRR